MEFLEPKVYEDLLRIAEEHKPTLTETVHPATAIVTTARDPAETLGWAVSSRSSPNSQDQPIYKEGDSVIFDFGRHNVGTVAFLLTGIPLVVPGRELHGSHVDSPARLRFTFGEVLRDVCIDLYPWNGWLSGAFLPDEIMNVDWLPQEVVVPRRHAFRYVKIDMIFLSERYGIKFENMRANAVTSMPQKIRQLQDLDLSRFSSLSASDAERFRAIDQAAISTLRGCMQTVYEDGPRRDMRQWIGDLRLQALSAYTLFDGHTVVKRSLALFAGLPFDDEGRVPGTLYEKPAPLKGGSFTVDYSIIFTVVLYEYAVATNDLEFAKQVYAIALRQFELVARFINDDFLFVDDGSRWIFIDWDDDLDRQAAMQAIYIWGLLTLIRLAELLNMDEPYIQTRRSSARDLSRQMQEAARGSFWDEKLGLFTSGLQKQVSFSTQAFMILADVPESVEQAKSAVDNVRDVPGARKPVSPYAHHYYVEAMLKTGQEERVLQYILDYWGSMVDAGGSTFFEVWVPEDPDLSPYGGVQNNSYCHAWSCTPSWFLRKIFH